MRNKRSKSGLTEVIRICHEMKKEEIVIKLELRSSNGRKRERDRGQSYADLVDYERGIALKRKNESKVKKKIREERNEKREKKQVVLVFNQ